MIYTYRCKKCDFQFEVEVSRSLIAIEELGFSARPPCPKCNSIRTTKIITPPTIVFKGEGFTKSLKGE